MEELVGTFLLGYQLLCESHQPDAAQCHNHHEEEEEVFPALSNNPNLNFHAKYYE